MLRLELRLFRPSGRDEFLELARKDSYSRSSNRSHRQGIGEPWICYVAPGSRVIL